MPDGSKAKFRDVLAYRRYIIAHGRFMTATGRSGAEMERQKLVVRCLITCLLQCVSDKERPVLLRPPV